jgi:hypothetical protein
MAGGHHRNVLKPVTGITARLISVIVRAVLALFGSVLKIGTGSVKLSKPGNQAKDKDKGPVSISEEGRTGGLNMRGLCAQLLILENVNFSEVDRTSEQIYQE